MAENKKNIHGKSGAKDLFEQLPAEERNRLKEVWNKSEPAVGYSFEIPDDEIERALEIVHKKMDQGRDDYGNKPTKIRYWLLAAAILFITFGTAYLLIPVTMTVPHGEIIAIELPDGSGVEMNSGTKLRYSRLYTLLNRDITLNGEAFFTVQDDALPFRVFANGTVTEVTGTRFNVRSWNDEPAAETSIAVSSGQVLFYPENRREIHVELNSGETSRWNPDLEKPSVPQIIDIGQISAWRNRMLVFNNKPLLVIFKELERTFDIRIQLEAKNVGMDSLTTYYTEPHNPESIVEDICRVKGLRFARTSDGFRIFK
ncbi:MAG: FecR family protein [Balneolaceae bacterium]